MEQEMVGGRVGGVSKKDVARVVMDNRGLLLSIIMKVERDAQAAQDILSIATERALRYGPGQFEGKASLLTYVRKIAHNAACEYARQSVLRKRVLSYEGEAGDRGVGLKGMEGVADEGADVERDFEFKSELKRVEAELEKMRRLYPEAMRTWDLHRMEGLGYEEICAQLGLESSTARGHVSRMSQKLQKWQEGR